MSIKTRIAELIERECGLTLSEIESLFETPPEEQMGDLALPCFRLAKQMRKAPARIAAELADALSGKGEDVVEVRATGAYVNFYFDRQAFAEEFFVKWRQNDDGFVDASDLGKGRRVLIEFSSPNIAKPFHVGHAFSTCLGDALSNIYHYLGYDVLRLNHLGDYGTQFGKLIVAWQLWGSEEALRENTIEELTRVYVKFHRELKENPQLEIEGREAFRRLEEGGETERALWKKFRDFSLLEFERVYNRLGIRFDNYNGESFYSDKIPAVLERLNHLGLLEESEGAQVVNLDEFGLNPCLILKSDGTTIYASRDIAAIYYRDELWDFFRNVYVVGQEQINHFRQVFAVLKRAGFAKAEQSVHVPFGRVKFPDGKFSTREGNVILLEDLLNEAVAKTEVIIRENNSGMTEEEMRETAEKIGVAAVKYSFLKNGREKDILFSWEEILDFDQDSAPYLLYSYARARSILRKAAVDRADLSDMDARKLVEDEEFILLKELSQLQDVVIQAAESYEPCILMRHLSLIARSFNKYYHQIAILKTEDESLRLARLALVEVFSRQFRFALTLAGIVPVERM